MEILGLVGIIACLVCLIVLLVRKLLDKPESKKLKMITFASYIVSTIGIGFFNNSSVLDSMNFIFTSLKYGLLCIVLWKIIAKRENKLIMIKLWIGCNILSLITELLLFNEFKFVENLLDISVSFTIQLLVVMVVCFIKRDELGKISAKGIFVFSLIDILIFSLMPPADLIDILLTVFIFSLVAALPTFVIYRLYHKIYYAQNTLDKVVDTK